MLVSIPSSTMKQADQKAFGGTLSSYTWICLIIAFLQLRNPPVLPSLHQSPHKLTKPDGKTSDFADDLKKLSGYGHKNKSSSAELLFQFFRFYAHEFDYDKYVLSVRAGKLVTKHDKKWHYAINNQLCVEEPFNTSRNLGNTADEYSFRGLHMELRRAFDLISVANFEEACEEYVFPKEEERVWSRPAPQPRPVMLRSSSQTHSGRGGRGNHRGGRHNNNGNNNNNNYRGGNSNRRASSGVPAYDANNVFAPVGLPQDLQWYQNPQYQFQYAQQDLMTQMVYQENMRQQLHLYAQSPAFMQHQAQVMGQQRMSTSAGSTQSQQHQSSSDRSRTNSFDNPPLSAPMRPDLYALYGMALGPPYFPQAGYGTYPSSPSATNGTTQDFRRSLQRTVVTNETGVSASSSTLRSHSQPATRSPSSAQTAAGYFGSQPIPNPNMTGVPIPSFVPYDTDFGETPKARTTSPPTEEGKQAGYYLTESPNSSKQSLPLGPSNLTLNDLASQSSGPGRRRLSSDQLPQTILDRRMRRTSRSPSPLGHARAFSTTTASAPLVSAPFPSSQNSKSLSPSRPLVVNGSGLKTSVTQSPRQSSSVESNASVESLSTENPLHISGNGVPSYPVAPVAPVDPTMAEESAQIGQAGLPVVVNGTSAPAPTEDPSFRERIAMMNAYYMNTQHIMQEPTTGASNLGPSTQQQLLSRQPQNGIAPLDLAISEPRMDRPVGPDFAHLSPVYENRTPSPTVIRKSDTLLKHENNVNQSQNDNKSQQSTRQESRDSSKPTGSKPAAQRVNGSREHGHVRGAKSEGDGGWQKAGKGKKKGTNGFTQSSEQPPKHESERKGG